MELKSVTKRNAWPACIAVWQTMIKSWDTLKDLYYHKRKQEALILAGYEGCTHGCPMCEVYCDNDDKPQCSGCPIAHHYNIQYACEFQSAYRDFRIAETKETAERFLAELKHIRRLDELGLIDYSRPLRSERRFADDID